MLEAKFEFEMVYNGNSKLAKNTPEKHSGMIIEQALVGFARDIKFEKSLFEVG